MSSDKAPPTAGPARFGTLPVFLTSFSTILGATLFHRFGYAVGHVGFLGALLIIAIGRMLTGPRPWPWRRSRQTNAWRAGRVPRPRPQLAELRRKVVAEGTKGG